MPWRLSSFFLFFSLFEGCFFFLFFQSFFIQNQHSFFFFFQTPVCWWLFLLSLCGFFIELTDHFAQNSLKKATIKEQPREPAENVRDWRLWAWTRKSDRKTATRLNCPLPCFVLKAEREPVQRSAHLTTCTSFGHGKLCRLVKKKKQGQSRLPTTSARTVDNDSFRESCSFPIVVFSLLASRSRSVVSALFSPPHFVFSFFTFFFYVLLSSLLFALSLQRSFGSVAAARGMWKTQILIFPLHQNNKHTNKQTKRKGRRKCNTRHLVSVFAATFLVSFRRVSCTNRLNR